MQGWRWEHCLLAGRACRRSCTRSWPSCSGTGRRSGPSCCGRAPGSSARVLRIRNRSVAGGPAEYCSDAVTVLRGAEDVAITAVIVEVRYRCPAMLLVLAPDPAVARWASQAIELGHKRRGADRARPGGARTRRGTRQRRRILAEMQRFTPREAFELAVRAGIYTPDGRLTPPTSARSKPGARGSLSPASPAARRR
jgi:hypothetical protein